MKHCFTSLTSLAILFLTALSAPVERSDGALHHSHRGHLSSHRGLSHRIREALVKQPLNLTFTPIDFTDGFVHVEYGTLTQRQASGSQLSATLLEIGRDDELVHAKRFPGGDTQTALRSPGSYGGRHVMVSICTHSLLITVSKPIDHRGYSLVGLRTFS